MTHSSTRWIGILDLMLLAAVTSCAGWGPQPESAVPSETGDNYLTAKELEGTHSLDLFTAIQDLRPRWLARRGGYSLLGRATISIFVDGIEQQGSADILKNIRTTDVQSVRFLGARDATTRYGTNMTVGAIEVVTKH